MKKITSIFTYSFLLFALSSLSYGSDDVAGTNQIKVFNNDATRSFIQAINGARRDTINNRADVHGKNEDGNTAWDIVKQRIKNNEYLYVEYSSRDYELPKLTQDALDIIQMLTDTGVDTTPKISSLLQKVSDGYEFPTPLADDLFKFLHQIGACNEQNNQEKIDEYDEKKFQKLQLYNDTTMFLDENNINEELNGEMSGKFTSQNEFIFIGNTKNLYQDQQISDDFENNNIAIYNIYIKNKAQNHMEKTEIILKYFVFPMNMNSFWDVSLPFIL